MKASDSAAVLAVAILHLRQDRQDFFTDELFDEQGWNMLLSLFINDARGVAATGHLVADQTGGAAASASRWLQYLTAQGLIQGDGHGNLDDVLTLSPLGISKMEAYLEHVRSVIRFLR